jgi:hypothetical protein
MDLGIVPALLSYILEGGQEEPFITVSVIEEVDKIAIQ